MNPFTSKRDLQSIVFDQIERLNYSQKPEFSTYSISVPIGRAIDNNKVLILDSRRALQPYGAIGEICIVGKAVTRGYLNGQDAGQGFVLSPYDESNSMFCTGDMGRFLADGNIIYEGRRDQQISNISLLSNW